MAAYRRRSDGMFEIIRPRPSRRVRGALSTLAAALSLGLLPGLALVVFVSLGGVPLLHVAGVALVGTLTAVLLRRRTRAPGPAHPAPLRLAPPEGRETPAHLGARGP